MRTTIKLVLPLAVSVLCVSAVYTIYQVRTERRNLRNDLSHRSAVLAENLQESLESSSGRANDRSLNHIVERYGQREHLVGVAVYDADGKSIAITPGLSAAFASQRSNQWLPHRRLRHRLHRIAPGPHPARLSSQHARTDPAHHSLCRSARSMDFRFASRQDGQVAPQPARRFAGHPAGSPPG